MGLDHWKDVPPPEAPYPAGRLGERIEQLLRRVAITVFNAIREVLARVFTVGLESWMEAMEPQLKEMYGPLLGMITKEKEVPPELKHAIEVALSGKHQAGTGVLGALGSTAGSAVIGSLFPTLLSPLTYALNERMRPARPEPGAATAMKWRSVMAANLVDDYLREQGWPETMITAFEEILQPRVAEIDLLTHERRYGGSASATNEELRQRGWRQPDLTIMRELMDQIPGPADLIRMAVREAFTPSIVAAFNLGAELPGPFVEWMEKQGYSQEWAAAFWASHWELPSLSMGFEMYHRGVIDGDQLRLLIRTHDVSPFWRDKLEAISWSVPTRVDVRRMFEMGVVDRSWVKEQYVQMGYSPENAELLTQWTEVEYSADSRDLTKTDILRALESGAISDADALDMLRQIGYSTAAAQFYIARVHLEQAEEVIDEELTIIERQYRAGLIDEAQARAAMAALNLPEAQINRNLRLWGIRRESADRRPPAGTLERWYLTDIVTVGEFQAEMAGLGYTPGHIRWYVQSLDQRKAEEAAAEAERARLEQERIEAAEEKTAYEIATAELAVQIALQRQVIAASQQALNLGLTDTETLEVQRQIEQLDVEEATAREEQDRQRERGEVARQALRAKITDQEREYYEGVVDDAQQAIKALEVEQAEHKTKIAEWRVILVRLEEPAEIDQVKEAIALEQLEIARLEEQATLQREAITEAEVALRAKITDTERQYLETEVQEAAVAVRAIESQIGGLQTRQAELESALAQELTSEQRAALVRAIDEAKAEIARLQVERAEVKLEYKEE